jgi:hypothetical protein
MHNVYLGNIRGLIIGQDHPGQLFIFGPDINLRGEIIIKRNVNQNWLTAYLAIFYIFLLRH